MVIVGINDGPVLQLAVLPGRSFRRRVTVLRDVALCRWGRTSRRFGGSYCLHLCEGRNVRIHASSDTASHLRSSQSFAIPLWEPWISHRSDRLQVSV